MVSDNERHKVVFHNTNEIGLTTFPRIGEFHTHVTKATYYRLFLQKFLDEDIDRLLYLDGDIVVTGSLRPLWETKLNGYAIGAVTDMSESLQEYTRLGYPREKGYFNAGVLLINLVYWRDHDVQNSFLDLILNHPDQIKLHDQDVLNICFCDSKLRLPLKYNVQNGFFFKREYLELDAEKYKEQINEAVSDSVIIHYTCQIKPWYKESKHPLAKEFWKYLNMTEWKGYKAKWRFHYSLQGRLLRFLHILPELKSDYDFRESLLLE